MRAKTMKATTGMRGAALVMFVGVALGAMGAHALEGRLTALGMEQTWRTAVLYHLVHGLAMCASASVGRRQDRGEAAEDDPLRSVRMLFLAGVVLFSGSLYVLALGGPRWLGPVTPIGGLCFLAGWLLLAIRSGSGRSEPQDPE